MSRVLALAGGRYDTRNYIVSGKCHFIYEMHYWLQIERAQGESEKAIHHRLFDYVYTNLISHNI